MASAQAELGELELADSHYQQAVDGLSAALGSGHPHVAIALSNRGALLVQRGQPDEALPLHRRAVAIAENVYGIDHPWVAAMRFNLADAVLEAGDPAHALALFRRCLATWQDGDGVKPQLADGLTGVGKALLRVDRSGEALPLLRRAVELYQPPASPVSRARAQALLAQALATTGDVDDEARALAEAARQVFSRTPRGHVKELAEIETLLAAMLQTS